MDFHGPVVGTDGSIERVECEQHEVLPLLLRLALLVHEFNNQSVHQLVVHEIIDLLGGQLLFHLLVVLLHIQLGQEFLEVFRELLPQLVLDCREVEFLGRPTQVAGLEVFLEGGEVVADIVLLEQGETLAILTEREVGENTGRHLVYAPH